MEALTGFILPIIASVITGVLVDYISKWLDRKRSEKKRPAQQQKRQRIAPLSFLNP